MIRILHIITAMLFFAVTSSAQTPAEVPVRYVSKSKGNYTNDGRSWATAKNNLQDAIEDLRKYMDENNLTKGHVYVSAGRYTPTTATPGGDGTLYTSFILYDGISVYGGFNPDTPEDKPGDRVLTNGSTIGTAKGETWLLKHETILSGNHTSTTGNPLTWDSGKNQYTETFTGNSYHVVWFASAGFDDATNRAKALGETAVLDGFTIRDGQSSNRITPAANDGSHAYHNSYGGGVYMVAGSEVRNCFITQNASTLRGGGVYMDGGGLLEQCYVIRNQSAGVGVTDGYGGGVAMDDGGMVRYCVIENNVARGGGGLALLYSKVPEDDKRRYATAVVGTVINNNTSTAEAGGVYMRNGGMLNHVTIARNKCVGVNVVYNNRRYARSGGLYVDGGALVVNSVIWGNEVAANNNVQYATYRESAATTKTTLAYVALSHGNYSDWGGTIKKTNGVYYLSDDNTNTAVASFYPEFVKPTSTAGVIASDGNDNMDYEYDKSDWTPRFFSYLRHKGIQIDNYPNNSNIYHGRISCDYGGDAFAPRCVIGALVPYPIQGANAAELPDLENSGKTVRTVFVDPKVEKSKSLDTSDETKVGSSWETPFYNINDALYYVNGLADAPSPDSPIQIVVKEGTTTTAGNAYLSYLRASTITVPSNVHLYGGFPESLTGTDISRRDPKNHPTRITANITGGSYKDNGTHIIVIGHGTSNAVVDGFQLYFANTQPNEVLKELGVRSGAGIAVLNAPTYPSTGKPTPAMTGNIIRNCIVANCTAPQGAALYMGNYSGRTMELKVENCIFHNNAVLAADSAIVAVSGENTRLELNHCLVRGNVGYAVQAMNNAGITMTNTALHANIGFDSAPADANLKVADLTATADKADGRVRTFNVLNGGTLTGNNNMMDIGLTDFTDVADPILRYHSTYTNENPNFVNATSNIGVNMDGDVTVYGSDPDWMPTNTNPMVNAATDDGMKGYDLTGNTTRDYGGAADIGALENTYQPAFGKVIYVRDGNTTDTGGDGSSWAKAINGNSLAAKYKNNHHFDGVDAELYPEGEQLTGLQWAVDEAFYRSLEKDGDNIKYSTINGVTHFNPGSQSNVNTSRTTISVSNVLKDKRVEVWVAEGEYLRREGFFMREGVDVYGGFAEKGNPGMNERQPKTYETVIETNKSAEVTEDNVTGEGQWGPQVYDFNKGITYTETTNSWKVVDYSSDDDEGLIAGCIDGNTETFWHSRWDNSKPTLGHGTINGGLPQWVIIDMGEIKTVRSLKITNRYYHPTSYTIGYAINNPDANIEDHSVNEKNFTLVNKSVEAAEEHILDLGSNISCRYLYIKVNKSWETRYNREASHVDIREIQAYSSRNAANEITHVTSQTFEDEAVKAAVYDLNAYANAYKTQRVLTQPYPYFKGTKNINGSTAGENLEFDNKTFNPFAFETTWDGFVIQNGRCRITHQRDGGAGVALRENGRLANCVVRNNILKAGTNARGGAIFQNGGIIENCVVEGNSLIGEGGNVYGAGMYQRTGTVFNTSIVKNVLKGNGTLQGTAIFFENGRFYNNTVTENNGPLTVFSGNWFSNGEIGIYNTIFYNNGHDTDKGEFSYDETRTPPKMKMKNCLFSSTASHTEFGAAFPDVYTNTFQYATQGVPLFDVGSLAQGKYNLATGAPAINAGTEDLGMSITDNTKYIVLPSYDADYTDRVKDCIVDIGAYEYNGALDIMPDESMGGFAFFYVTPFGTGNASGNSPDNAACWMKLQKILDAAGRYVYTHKDDETRKKVVVKIAGDAKREIKIGNETKLEYTGFTYRPRRSNTVTSPGEEENPRTYSLIVPHGVEVWGGYHEDFYETRTETDEDGKEMTVTVDKRDILEYRTSFSGIFRQDDVDVQAYNVVTFTDNTYDADGELLVEDALANIQERAVLDGIFIENGMADGERMSTGELAETRVGGAAIVTGYAHIRNCIVQNNTAADMGGGLYLKPGALVSGSIIQYNAVTGGDGGGVYVEEPEEATGNYARIYTSDVIYNTASRAGGGIYFYTNLRANSSLFWQNASGELANVAGETMPTDAGDRELGINDYPVSFCATETTREPGINNIAVNTDMNKGVRFDDESYNHDYIASDGTPVKVMHNDHEFYKLEKYSLIVRSGMEYSEYNNLLKNNKDLLKVDLAGVDRTGYDNEFIDIGARAYPGRVLPEIDENNLMTRIFVAKNEYEVSMDAVNVMRNQTDNTYYSQEGSSFAYPMRYLGDALEYVRSARKKKNEKGEYINKNIKFEIVLGGGTFYPRRNIKGEYINSRGCTFLVPEGVTLVGGVSVENDGKYYGNVPAVGGIAENTATTTFTDAESGMSVVIDYANIESIIKRRKLHDINHNNIAEPWEMEIQTILSGQVINSTSSYNVYHVMACIADESCVGGMPDPTYTYTIDGAGTGRMPKYRGVPIVIDGINLEDGMALKYVEGAVNSKYTYYKGGAICVEGNWTNDGFVNEGGLDARPVGYRNIPLEVRNCSFMNNSGGRGGAIFTDGALKVFACNFAQNYAQVGSDTFRDGDNDVTISYAGRGGAINATYETIIVNSLFANNEAEVEDGSTGDMSGVGGALLMGEHSKLHAVNCNFVRNKAYGYPAIYCYQPNKGFTAATKGDEEQLKADNLHKVINSIFWGNESVNEDMDKVINFKKYNADGTIDAGGTMSDSPEALWFCAYEEGKGNEPVYSSNDIDYRLQDYKGYILTPEESDNPDDRFIGNGTYIPYLWKGEYTKLADDNVSLIVGGTSNPDVVDGLNPVTNNIIINSDNDAIDGPNFISPSPKAGKSGFYVSADWMIGRINNLVDNGWTYLQQDLSGEDPKFVYEDEANQRNVVGAGIYHSASYDYGKLSEERTAIPIGDDLYMSYSDAEAKPFLRVSTDPNPTHNQTFIDIGVYEYQHVKLSPNTEGHTDILWVTEKERTGGNISDGKTWATATSDLQRAIETLLASRNGHDKEIRMLAGRYQPVYTINGNLAFTVTTNLQTGITPPDEKTETERGMQGVKSLTIRGGYSNELEGRENIENNPVYIYASERMGGNLNRGHVFVIEDMRQRLSGKDDKRELQEYVVPVVFKGLNISNTKANDDLSGGGVAVYYKDTDAKKKTYAVKKTAQDYNTKVEYTYDDISGEAGTDGKELYKFVMSQCSFFNNGSPEEESMPSVTIGKGGGNALICNSLFHSNKGNALIADNTKVVNCTFALNDSPIVFTNTGDDVSELHNSILWRNALKGGVSSETNPDVTGLAANTEDKPVMTSNAMSYLNREHYNNVPLSVNNTDVINGPNFFDPMEVPDGTSAADLTVTVSPRDFHVNPSSKILSKGDVDIYVKLVKDLTGEYPYTADSNIERVRQDKDLADITRFYGSGLERGAYECVVALNRVLYVDPKKAILGNGISWENAYGKGQIQTAIDAASVYYDVSDGGTEAERRAYVFVKGLENKHTDEALIMRNGVSLYGSIDPTYIKQVDGEVKEGETNVTYSNENIDAYLTLMKADREGMAMSEHTVVGSVKAGDNVDFCLFDGLEIGSGDGNEPAETTEPVVSLGQNSTVALVNSVINNNKVTGDAKLIENHSGLLYNVLVRDNGKADVDLGADGYMLNCTLAGETGSWESLLSPDNSRSINNIVYRDGDRVKPFAPYFRPSDVAYHAGDVPDSDNRNLWYQLHEKARYIGTGSNNDDVTGKQLLSNAALREYVDFTVDRDLLGNPRVLGNKIDFGCYETWSTGSYESLSSAAMTPETLFANRHEGSYAGNHYPHEGSVVYLQDKGNLVCELAPDTKSPYFTEEKPLKPGYLLAMEGGSLYGQGNEIRLQYVAAERKVAGRYAMVAMPFDMKNDDNHITCTTYAEEDGKVISMAEEVAGDGYGKYWYDGKERSGWNYEYNADNSSCWKPVDETFAVDGVIAANDGILLDRGDNTGGEVLRFTSFGNASSLYPYQEGAADKIVTLVQHDQSDVDAGGSSFRFTSEYNMGWNLKGVPYLISGYDTGVTGDDGRETMFVPHVLYTMNDEGKYETKYSWKWDETASATLSPGDAFFTQTAVIGDGKTENLRFSKLYYADNASGTVAYRMPALAMSAEGYGTDEVIILPYGEETVSETGSGRAANGLDYRFGVDGVKFASLNDTLPQISVCGTDGVGLSLLSHAPVGTEIPLTVSVKGESAYTFSLTDKTVYAAYANVCIKDKVSGTVANLLSGDYTTSVSPSDSPSRFSLVIGGSMEADQRRRKTGMYNTGGIRVSKPYGTGVYIEVGDKVRKVLKVR